MHVHVSTYSVYCVAKQMINIEKLQVTQQPLTLYHGVTPCTILAGNKVNNSKKQL